MPAVALHHLSLRDVAPEVLVRLAADAGLAEVSVFVRPPAPRLDIFPRVTSAGLGHLRTALALTGVRVAGVEAFAIGPRTDPSAFRPDLDLAAEIGASRLCALVHDADSDRAADRLARLAEAAAERGIATGVEFMAFSSLRNLPTAADFVARVPGVRVIVDALHLARSGGSPADIAATDPAQIGVAQLCDARTLPPPDPFAEAVEDRLLPGEGEQPLSDFLAFLPPETPVEIEVPMTRLSHWPPSKRLSHLLRAVQPLLPTGA